MCFSDLTRRVICKRWAGNAKVLQGLSPMPLAQTHKILEVSAEPP